ncbi:SH3 domain-containing protein [[Limnothrix rosea] IAM M-220]|uniref:SH3 domain-containing protein n=1 Tax=[Limnothrix rosea] IAM M-220 TaxID=454133 RepID=UPI000965400B|nr:SH3 domain-containing protein [[Limnothrix rosea] IAM M-220]OKH18599.1 hypothetical protein NIES208_05165 [[Limnothrix rosea] IAM M-220]
MNTKKWTIILGIASIIAAQNYQSSTVSAQTDAIGTETSACREVNVDNYLNVRSAPGGEVIGRLPDDQQVSISAIGNGWVSISAPVEGYVSSSYLVYCADVPNLGDYYTPTSTPVASQYPHGGDNTSTVPGSNCRQINTDGLPVMDEPNGNVIGQLMRGQAVMMANEGFNGWVPIESPVSGYVSAEFLTGCSAATMDTVSTMGQESVTTVAGANCRRTVSPDVQLRYEPMGTVIGMLPQNQRVYIANEGYDGWVPVEKPASGYVASANLGSC